MSKTQPIESSNISARRNSQRGITMISIVVASALGMLVMMGSLRFVRMSSEVQSRAERRAVLSDLEATLALYLSNQAGCTTYFGGRRFNPLPESLSEQTIPNTFDTDLVVIHAPNDSSSVLLENGRVVHPGILIQDVRLQNLRLNQPMNYIADVSFSGQLGGKLPFERRVPITMTTEPVDRRVVRITSCAAIAQGNGQSAPMHQTVIARHSLTQLVPSCPSGWDTLWTGYSYGGSSGGEWTQAVDLGGSGSCMEDFSPLPFMQCGWGGLESCAYDTPGDRSIWLTNRTSDEMATLSLLLIRPKLSRCSVCAKPTSVLVRHSRSSTAPSCPNKWSSIWTGYTFFGMTPSHAEAHGDLTSVGSCLEVFRPVPFMECTSKNICDFFTAEDQASWGYAGPVNLGYVENPAPDTRVGRCNVCEYVGDN